MHALLLTVLGQIALSPVSPFALEGSQPSPVVGAWSAATGGSWVGLPAPTIDCTADAAGGGMTCVGATASKQGSPTSSTGYFGAAQGAAEPIVVLNGSSDYYDLGDVGDATTAMWWCAKFASTDSDGLLVDKNTATATNSSYYMLMSGAGGSQLKFFTYADDGQYNGVLGTLTSGVRHVCCGSYDGTGGDGSAVQRINCDGVAGTPVTNGHAPMHDTTATLYFGRYHDNSEKYAGSINQIRIGIGSSLSAAQLSRAVLAQYIPEDTKPSGTAEAITRNAAENIVIGSTMYSVPANTLAIGTSGAQVFRDGYNYALQSEAISGYSSYQSTPVADQYAFLDGNTTGDKITCSGDSCAQYEAITITGATSLVASTWVRSDTGTSAEGIWTYSDAGGITSCICGRDDGGACTATVLDSAKRCVAHATVGTSWVRLWAASVSTAWTTGSVGVFAGTATARNGAVGGFDGVQVNTGVLSPLPYYKTTSGTVSFPATVWRPTSQVTLGPLCTTVTVTAPWGLQAVGLFSYGTGNNSISATYSTAGALSLSVIDSIGGINTWATAGLGLTAYTQHALTSCYSHDGTTAAFYLDGVAVANSMTISTGTGKSSALGAYAVCNDGVNYCNGTVASRRECTSTRGGKCK